MSTPKVSSGGFKNPDTQVILDADGIRSLCKQSGREVLCTLLCSYVGSLDGHRDRSDTNAD